MFNEAWILNLCWRQSKHIDVIEIRNRFSYQVQQLVEQPQPVVQQQQVEQQLQVEQQRVNLFI